MAVLVWNCKRLQVIASLNLPRLSPLLQGWRSLGNPGSAAAKEYLVKIYSSHSPIGEDEWNLYEWYTQGSNLVKSHLAKKQTSTGFLNNLYFPFPQIFVSLNSWECTYFLTGIILVNYLCNKLMHMIRYVIFFNTINKVPFHTRKL